MSALRETLRRAHHRLPPRLRQLSGSSIDTARRARRAVHRPTVSVDVPTRRELADRTYAWWWWRSLNRPRLTDSTYHDVVAEIPAGSAGLDLGSRNRIRPDALTVDVVAAEGVDIVADGHDLPFVDGSFDYVWCNAVLEHVRNPFQVASEIVRVLRPGGLAIVQVPFLESIHSWPDDYFRFTPNGLRQLFSELDEVAAGTSAGPGQVLPDLIEHYGAGFADVHGGSLAVNLWMVVLGTVLWPVRALDALLQRRPGYWKWARAYYHVGRKPPLAAPDVRARPLALFVRPSIQDSGFDEVMGLRAREQVQAMARAGIDAFVIDADAAADQGSRARAQAASAAPDLVLGPNLNYMLTAAESNGSVIRATHARPVCLWDDPLGALALLSLERRGVQMGSLGPSAETDALAAFAETMRIGGAAHFAWDSGHIEVASKLGLLEQDAVQWYPIATYEPFLARGREPAEPLRDLAFCGNVYPELVANSVFADLEPYAGITAQVSADKTADLGRPVWELLEGALAALPDATRLEHGLDVHDARFWDYYVYLFWLASLTHVRLSVLGGLPWPVEVFGVFGDPQSVARLAQHTNLVYRGNAHQFAELPDVFATTKVNICPSNTLIHSGVPSKFVDCIASGGFALVDPKPDLVTLFGPVVQEVFFRDADELATKVEHYVQRPAERREIVETLRATVARECTLDALFARVGELVGPRQSSASSDA